MSELLKIVLSLSLSGTLLFFIVLALKPLYKNKLSKRWQYYVWLIVIVRMLIPFTPETTLVGSAFQHLENINVETIQTTPSTNDTQADFDSDESDMLPNGQPQEPQSNTNTAPTISIQAIFSKVYENLWILWAAIAFALLIRKITMYQSFVRFVKAGRAEVSDIELLNTLADAGETVGVKRPVELFINPLISSPMLLGFFRPYIIFPSIELDSTELAYIMRHELTHYKHLDMFYKWLVQITVCLHWFNPFAYLMAKEINKGCELSCDEAIIRTMDRDEKKAYGDTLLNSLKAMGNYNDKLATVTLAESAEQLKERLDAIMKYKKLSRLTTAISLVLACTLCFGATVVGAYTTNPAHGDYAAGRTTTSNIQEIKEIPVNATKITTLELTGESGTYTDGSICVSGNGYIVFDVQLQSGSMKELAIQNAWTNEVLYSIDKPKTALYSGIFSENKVDSEYKFSFVEAKKLQGSITVLCVGATAVGAYAAPYQGNRLSKNGDGTLSVSPILSTNSNILYEDGIFYILCDGATANDRPISGITDGFIGLTLVWKDQYSTYGPYNDLQHLVDEVKKQCDYLLGKKSITQDEAKLVVESATKIQSGNYSDLTDRKSDVSKDKEYEKWKFHRLF